MNSERGNDAPLLLWLLFHFTVAAFGFIRLKLLPLSVQAGISLRRAQARGPVVHALLHHTKVYINSILSSRKLSRLISEPGWKKRLRSLFDVS